MAAWKTIDRIGCLLGLLCMLLGAAVPAGVAAAAGRAAIEPRSQWKYYDGGKDLGEAWRQPAYDDRAWKTGAAPLGYGQPSLAPSLSFGPNRKNKFVTSYFRTTFAVTDTQAVDRLSLSVLYDDGFVAYLNGTEIARSNIAITRTLSFNLLADKMHAARAFETFARPQAIALLVPGQNVLAVEVHQASKISDELECDAALALGPTATPP